MLKLFSFLLLLMSYASVHNSHATVESKPSETVPADTLIRMERTPCFGTCPYYELNINGKGKVTFEGKEFVEHIGVAESEISQMKLNQLVQLIEDINFMQLSSNPGCESWMTDHPSVFLTVELGDQRNSFTHYLGCKGFEFEEELYRLEAAIDSLSGARRWIGEG